MAPDSNLLYLRLKFRRWLVIEIVDTLKTRARRNRKVQFDMALHAPVRMAVIDNSDLRVHPYSIQGVRSMLERKMSPAAPVTGDRSRRILLIDLR
jgi:hypothetical protein